MEKDKAFLMRVAVVAVKAALTCLSMFAALFVIGALAGLAT